MSTRVQNGDGIEGTERRPLGTVVASAVEGFRALARAHVDLAKLEVSEAASARAQGAGMFGAAAEVHPGTQPGIGGDPVVAVDP